jgi:hypothetical protein
MVETEPRPCSTHKDLVRVLSRQPFPKRADVLRPFACSFFQFVDGYDAHPVGEAKNPIDVKKVNGHTSQRVVLTVVLFHIR